MQHSMDRADARLPGLAAALDAEQAGPRLRELLGATGAPDITVLKHTRGKRCVIGYAFAGGQRAVGKLYRKQRGETHAGTLTALHAALRGTTRTPALLAYWADLDVVVQPWLDGEPAPHYAEYTGRAPLVQRLGRALAEFHEARVGTGRLLDLAGHLRRTCGRDGLDGLRAAMPHAGALLRSLEQDMLRHEQKLHQPLSPTHGDFAPRQILLAPERVWIVDVDGFSHSDPGLDVANFRVGLQVHLAAEGSALADAFLHAYLDARGLQSLPSVSLWEAFALLRRAVILWRKRAPEWEAQALLLADRARLRLAA